MEGQLCIFLSLDQFSEQRANWDVLPTKALGVYFLGCLGSIYFYLSVLLGFYTGYKLLLFFISDHICLTGKHGNQQLFWQDQRRNCCPSSMDHIQITTDEKHSIWEFFHSNTSTAFIWHKMVMMSVLWRALSTWWRSRFPELILWTLNSAMSTSYNRFSSVKCYQYLLKGTSHNNSCFFTKPLSTG